MEQVNPFALVRASDYTDEQINSLWVEIGPTAINTIIEPRSRISKFILGGKGTGKTHLLRYYSYPVARLRTPNVSGIAILQKQQFLAIFLRATGVDAARFEPSADDTRQWQQLFGVYLELKLVEGVLDALCDIKASSSDQLFDDKAFMAVMGEAVSDSVVLDLPSISDFRKWIIRVRRGIDAAVNNAAFAGSLDVRIPFSIGSLCLPVGRAIAAWNPALSEMPLLYLIDEIENFSASQQQVVNSLIRYGEGLATFRVTGRLYARKTQSTLSGGEENREGAEFKTTFLDDILRAYPKYPDFAKRFVIKRLATSGLRGGARGVGTHQLDPASCFEEIRSDDFYSAAVASLNINGGEPAFVRAFVEALRTGADRTAVPETEARAIARVLTHELPPMLQKLNLLLYCKKYRRRSATIAVAEKIRKDSLAFLGGMLSKRNYYPTAYSHYSTDLFAQLCRESKKVGGAPYAGFDTFVRMSSGNPRNLLIILGRAFAIAEFRGVQFITGPKLSVALQTEAAVEAARFMFEADTNFGDYSGQARDAVARLAAILRTARYALNIPEVSPLAVSFAESDLTQSAKKTLRGALNLSLIFAISDGRPDRNSQRVNTKIQLNPLLSPRWGLPISRRGDLGLNRDLVNAVFDPERQEEFDLLLRGLNAKWNKPFSRGAFEVDQSTLF